MTEVSSDTVDSRTAGGPPAEDISKVRSCLGSRQREWLLMWSLQWSVTGDMALCECSSFYDPVNKGLTANGLVKPIVEAQRSV